MVLRLDLDEPVVLVPGAPVGRDSDSEAAAVAQVTLDVRAGAELLHLDVPDVVVIVAVDGVEQPADHVVITYQVIQAVGNVTGRLALVASKI